MIRRAILALTLGAATCSGVPAFADEAAKDDTARADALFKVAKDLKSDGRWAEACAMFDQSKRAANGVGVTLHLADCYEHVGRVASAWAAFLDAEALAQEKKDKRASVAHDRAQALLPKLNRVTFVVAPAAAKRGVDLRVDGGGAVPADHWTAGVALDPGKHVVTFRLDGLVAHRLDVDVDASHPVTTVRIDDEPPPAPPPVVATKPPPPAAPMLATTSATARMESDPNVTRRWVGFGLFGAGIVGLGVGTAFLVEKNSSMDKGGPVDRGAQTGSTIAYSVGAAAIVSAIIYYLAVPSKDGATTGSSLTPGGGLLRGTF